MDRVYRAYIGDQLSVEGFGRQYGTLETRLKLIEAAYFGWNRRKNSPGRTTMRYATRADRAAGMNRRGPAASTTLHGRAGPGIRCFASGHLGSGRVHRGALVGRAVVRTQPVDGCGASGLVRDHCRGAATDMAGRAADVP